MNCTFEVIIDAEDLKIFNLTLCIESVSAFFYEVPNRSGQLIYQYTGNCNILSSGKIAVIIFTMWLP